MRLDNSGGRGGGALAAVPDLSVAETLAGKRILFTGATGFVGKVALSMLLSRFPHIEKIYVMARPGVSTSADARFFGKVVVSPAFDPLRTQHGAELEAFLQKKCQPVAGDVSKKWCGLSEETLEALTGKVDLLINSAGLVDFTPTLEAGLNANAIGAVNVGETALRLGAKLVHVSTCFVVGNRPGIIQEEEELIGYFPKREERPEENFDPFAEIEDCKASIARIKAMADDKALLSEFRAKALARLHREGRDESDAKAVRTGTMRERKVWLTEQLIKAGIERSRYWGWANTYCYTKSLGDQVLDGISRRDGLDFTVVRPAIVESALRFPFPGWNEGFTTTAPLTFLALKGHRTYPTKEGLILDVIPVDHIAAGVIAAGAALLAGKAKKVYQLGTSDSNPLRMERSIELTGLYRRRHYMEKAKEEGGLRSNLLARLEPQAVPLATYQRRSAPEVARLSKKLAELLDEIKPSWGAPRLSASIEGIQSTLEQTARQAEMASQLFEIFLPFVWENEYIFSSKNMRELFARMDPADQERIPWDPESFDWLDYWLNIHMVGLEKWVYPNLEDELGGRNTRKGVPAYRDLWELLEARARRHPGKVAMRRFRADGSSERYTYGQLRDRALRVALFLVASGLERGDRVLLLSESRPEWAMAYFGAVRAGATVVPVDPQSSREEVENLVRSAGATAVVASAEVMQRLKAGDAWGEAQVIALESLFHSKLPAALEEDVLEDRVPAELASLIFTSGTTGKPKGVMLSGRNFTTLVSRLSQVFPLGERDGLLSVLALHHTFEFTCGLLVPLACGAEIAYLEELTGDSIGRAFRSGRITAMVGVPAIWQLLLRRIEGNLAGKGLLRPAQVLQGAARKASDATGSSLPAKAAFFPVHRTMGGRLRFLISGGSSMPMDVYNAFRGMGFQILEGYGLTEAAPVLTVQKPGENRAGHVGKAVPGVEVRIHEPDENGVGEIIAKGPNVMLGYWEDPEATAAAIRDGWLHTGDLGRLDEEGNLVIAGRQKEVIIDANGKNVYPDELEEFYGNSPHLDELSIVGLPEENGAEKVACLAVPKYAEGADREETRQALLAHFQEVGSRLPLWKRIKVLHLRDAALPRTATLKVKRREVVQELIKLEKASRGGKRGGTAEGDAWLYELVARICEQPLQKVVPEARLEQDLGFDSLTFTELGAALEAEGVSLPSPEVVMTLATVADLSRLVARRKRVASRSAASRAREKEGGSTAKRGGSNLGSFLGSVLDAVQPALERVPMLASAAALVRAEGLDLLDDLFADKKGEEAREEAESIELPDVVVAAGKGVLSSGQRGVYELLFDTKIYGKAHIPQHTNFLVAANHASHLDMGLVKHALGDQGKNLVALAARDYFFANRWKRAYFENFTQLIPMERHGSLRESLELASRSLRQGKNLLIFPEGTRATDGAVKEFKGSLGYLALTNKVGILPIYLRGTFEALPKGKVLPQNRELAACIGPYISYETLLAVVKGLPRSEQHRRVARLVEEIVLALRDGRPIPPLPAAEEGEAEEARAAKGRAAGAARAAKAPARKREVPPERARAGSRRREKET